jgi:hypothetical protein
MAHGCGLTSVRGNRGENYEKRNRWFTKNIQRKKKLYPRCKEEKKNFEER